MTSSWLRFGLADGLAEQPPAAVVTAAERAGVEWIAPYDPTRPPGRSHTEGGVTKWLLAPLYGCGTVSDVVPAAGWRREPTDSGGSPAGLTLTISPDVRVTRNMEAGPGGMARYNPGPVPVLRGLPLVRETAEAPGSRFDLTVVLKTFLRPTQLRKSLEALTRLLQGLVARIIVIDDSDASWTIPGAHARPLGELLEQAKRTVGTERGIAIDTWRFPFDIGVSTGRNLGISLVETAWFLNCDDDLTYSPKLRAELETIWGQARDVDADLICADWVSRRWIHVRGGKLWLSDNPPPVERKGAYRVQSPATYFLARTDAFSRRLGLAFEPECLVGEHGLFSWDATWAGARMFASHDMRLPGIRQPHLDSPAYARRRNRCEALRRIAVMRTHGLRDIHRGEAKEHIWDRETDA